MTFFVPRAFPSINQRPNSGVRVNRLTRRHVRFLSVSFECAAPPSDPLKSIRPYTTHISRPHLPKATCCWVPSWLIPCLSTHTQLYFPFYFYTSLSVGLTYHSFSPSVSFHLSVYPTSSLCPVLLPLFIIRVLQHRIHTKPRTAEDRHMRSSWKYYKRTTVTIYGAIASARVSNTLLTFLQVAWVRVPWLNWTCRTSTTTGQYSRPPSTTCP
jgi:hypothetical protein